MASALTIAESRSPYVRPFLSSFFFARLSAFFGILRVEDDDDDEDDETRREIDDDGAKRYEHLKKEKQKENETKQERTKRPHSNARTNRNPRRSKLGFSFRLTRFNEFFLFFPTNSWFLTTWISKQPERALMIQFSDMLIRNLPHIVTNIILW